MKHIQLQFLIYRMSRKGKPKKKIEELLKIKSQCQISTVKKKKGLKFILQEESEKLNSALKPSLYDGLLDEDVDKDPEIQKLKKELN